RIRSTRTQDAGRRLSPPEASAEAAVPMGRALHTRHVLSAPQDVLAVGEPRGAGAIDPDRSAPGGGQERPREGRPGAAIEVQRCRVRSDPDIARTRAVNTPERAGVDSKVNGGEHAPLPTEHG